MKPQLYSIFVLLLSRIKFINCVESSATLSITQDANVSATQLPLSTPVNSTTFVTKTPDDNVTSVTEAPVGNTTSVTKTSDEATTVSEVPGDNITFVSEAPNSNATSAPSKAPSMASSMSPASNITGSTTIANSATKSAANQTFNPDMAGKTTTEWIRKVTISNEVKFITHTPHHAIKPTVISVSPDKTTRNRTSTLPVPSLFAITLLIISVLCF